MYVQYLKSFHYFRNIACFDRQFSFRFHYLILLYVYISGTPDNWGNSNHLIVLVVEKGQDRNKLIVSTMSVLGYEAGIAECFMIISGIWRFDL